MPNELAKMRSWQFFHFVRKHLGRSVLYSVFGKKNARAVDYWCEDPRFTAKPEKAYDPLQGIKDTIDLLDDRGHCDVVRSVLTYLAAGTSSDNGDEPVINELLPTLTDEILADFRAVAALQTAIESETDIEEIEILKRDAIAEIERTVARYIQDI